MVRNWRESSEHADNNALCRRIKLRDEIFYSSMLQMLPYISTRAEAGYFTALPGGQAMPRMAMSSVRTRQNEVNTSRFSPGCAFHMCTCANWPGEDGSSASALCAVLSLPSQSSSARHSWRTGPSLACTASWERERERDWLSWTYAQKI